MPCQSLSACLAHFTFSEHLFISDPQVVKDKMEYFTRVAKERESIPDYAQLSLDTLTALDCVRLDENLPHRLKVSALNREMRIPAIGLLLQNFLKAEPQSTQWSIRFSVYVNNAVTRDDFDIGRFTITHDSMRIMRR